MLVCVLLFEGPRGWQGPDAKRDDRMLTGKTQRVKTWVATNSCTWTCMFKSGSRRPSTTPWSLITYLDWLRTTRD